MYYSPTELKQLYYSYGAKNGCPIKEANWISLIHLTYSYMYTNSIFTTSSEYVLDGSTCTTSLAIDDSLTLLIYVYLTSLFMVFSDAWLIVSLTLLWCLS